MSLNRRGNRVRAAWLVLLGLPGLVCAQQASAPAVPLASGQTQQAPQRPAHPIPEGRIHLDVAVNDAAGKPVRGLSLKDLTLLDDGSPAAIGAFRAVTGSASSVVPASGVAPAARVLLVLDTVNLSTRQVAESQNGVVEFLRRNGGRLDLPVSVYRLSYEGLLETPDASTDGNALAAQITHGKGMRALWQGDEGYHAGADPSSVNQVHRSLLSLNALGSIALEQRTKPGRKILIWIGNGWPVDLVQRQMFNDIVEFSTRLREARIALCRASAWPTPEKKFREKDDPFAPAKSEAQAIPGKLNLEVLAQESGGMIPDPLPDLAGQIGQIIAAESSFYSLSFDPPPTQAIDEYHGLRVQVAGAGLTARTNTGYYDQPAYYDQPSEAPERMKVEELEQALASVRGSSDVELSRRLSRMALTERMNSSRLAGWKERLPGPKSWAALVQLSDASAFLNLPAAEVPGTAAPAIAEQRRIISQAIHYLIQSIPQLPNFFATRTTVRYAEQPAREELTSKAASGDRILHVAAVSAGTVLYRNGDEVVDSEMVKGRKPKKEVGSLTTKGTFGPILSTVIVDGAGVRGAFVWSRWEQSGGGQQAVFRYAIPQGKSHFEVTHCCLADGTNDFQEKSGYHGEIGIDPASGAILRISIEAELPADAPIIRSATLVEYSSISIAGRSYVCPVRSIAISRGRRMSEVREWGATAEVSGPYETMLNDVRFDDYHIFRSQSRVITENLPPPDKQ